MEKKGKDFFVDLYVDTNNIGFDINPQMADYENVVAFDNNKITDSRTLSINIQGEYLNRITEKMSDNDMHVLNVYVYMFKPVVDRIVCNARNNGKIVPLTKKGDIYYGIDDLTGRGHALYVDSYGTDLKKNAKTVKIEIRTFKKGSVNYTTVNTQHFQHKLLAAHNCLTYAENITHNDHIVQNHNRCQEVDIIQQYYLGVRMFDIRVRKGDDNKPIVAHGRVIYKSDLDKVFEFLNSKTDTYVRILLENYSLAGIVDQDDPSKADKKDFDWFRNYVNSLLSKYKKIKFLDGRSKCGKIKVAVNLPDMPSNYTESYIDSSSGPLEHRPAEYAMKYNHINRKYMNHTIWCAFDFVEILFS